MCNGSAWTVAAITGVDPAKLCGPISHANRLWFYERGTLTLWYLQTGTFQGEAKPVYLDAFLSQAGEIVSIGVLDGDGGTNPNDALVAVTNRGQMIVYDGPNPDTQATFSKRGVYPIPVPVGRKCLTKLGGDLSILTVNGVLSATSLMPSPDANKKTDGITESIRPPLIASLAATPNDPVWSVLDSSTSALIILNAPDGQWVMSPETKGWSRMKGLAATCWLQMPGDLYFGRADGKVCRYAGSADDGTAIQSLMITGWSRIKGAGKTVLHRCRPVFRANHPYRARIEAIRDYREPADGYPATYTDDGFWAWPETYEGVTGQQMIRPLSNRIGQWRGLSGHADDALAFIVAMKATGQIAWDELHVSAEKGKLV